MNYRAAVISCLLASAGGCGETPSPAELMDDRMDATVGTASPASLAGSLDRALRNQQTRLDFLYALRNSPYTDHRLQLSQVLRDDNRLLEAMGAHAHKLPRELLRESDSLDILVPSNEDRLTWRGSGNYVVIDVRHAMSANALQSARRSGAVTILIAPSEQKILRVDPQPIGPGRVIQDSTDGVFGALLTYTFPDGAVHSVQLANLTEASVGTLSECYENCEGGGGASSPPPDTTFLYSFEVFDTDCMWGDADPTFLTTYYRDGIEVASSSLAYSNIPPNEIVAPVVPLIFAKMRSTENDYIRVHVIERDNSFCGGDDDWGARNWQEADQGHWRDIDPEKVRAKLTWAPF